MRGRAQARPVMCPPRPPSPTSACQRACCRPLTGSGKTAAFGLPLLEYLDPENEETQAIVLTPTRELCIQVTQALRAYAEHLRGVNVVAVFGGAPIRDQQARLRSGAQVVV